MSLVQSLAGWGIRASTPERLSIVVTLTDWQGTCPCRCFPAMALSARRLPFLLRGPGEPSSPALSGTMKALRLPIRVSMVAYLVRFHCPRVTSAFVFASALLKARRFLFQARTLGHPAAPTAGLCLRGRDGISQVFRRSFLCLCSVPGPRSSRRALAITVTSVLPPLGGRRRPQRLLISGLTRSFSTRCPTLHARRCRSRARLACGRLARLCRVGVEPTGSHRGVSARVDDHSLLLLS